MGGPVIAVAAAPRKTPAKSSARHDFERQTVYTERNGISQNDSLNSVVT